MNKRALVGIMLAGAMAAGAVAVAGGVLSGGSEGPVTVVAAGKITDRTGDAAFEGRKGGEPPAAADLTGTSVELLPDEVAFTATVSEAADPFQDRGWSAPDTYLSWEVDTTGDGDDDYEVTYRLKGGRLGGEVTTVAANGDGIVRCEYLSATFDPTTGYTALIPAFCLGNPKSVAHRVTFYYQSDPGDSEAAQFIDVAPDKG